MQNNGTVRNVTIAISLNAAHVWRNVGCLLYYWIIMVLNFCLIHQSILFISGRPDFRWLWVCSGWYFKSLSPLRKPTLLASILSSQEWPDWGSSHYDDVTMSLLASQITSLTIVYSAVYSDADHRKHQSSASLAFVWVIHRGPVNSPHKRPVTRKMSPFDDVIMLDVHRGTAGCVVHWLPSTEEPKMVCPTGEVSGSRRHRYLGGRDWGEGS